MCWPGFYKPLLFFVWGLGSLLGSIGLIGEAAAQGFPNYPPSEIHKAIQPKEPKKAVPFANFEDRLRRSPRWQAMNPEEQARALETIKRARKQFIDRQRRLNAQYEAEIKKMEKPRESLVRKRRKRKQYQDIEVLWGRFQTLPLEQRLRVERQLGLNEVMPSQQRQKFQKRLDSLSYSKRQHLLRQLQ